MIQGGDYDTDILTAITPLGPKIVGRNDRYNTTQPKIRQKRPE